MLCGTKRQLCVKYRTVEANNDILRSMYMYRSWFDRQTDRQTDRWQIYISIVHYQRMYTMFNSAATWEGQASRSSCPPLLHLPPSPSPLFHLSFLSSSVRLSVLTLPIHHISSNMARTNVTKWYRTHFQVTSTRFRSALLLSSLLFSSLLFASLRFTPISALDPVVMKWWALSAPWSLLSPQPHTPASTTDPPSLALCPHASTQPTRETGEEHEGEIEEESMKEKNREVTDWQRKGERWLRLVREGWTLRLR